MKPEKILSESISKLDLIDFCEGINCSECPITKAKTGVDVCLKGELKGVLERMRFLIKKNVCVTCGQGIKQ